MKSLKTLWRKLCLGGLTFTAIGVLAMGISAHLPDWVRLTPASAQEIVLPPIVLPAPWTAVGASGTVDELSIPYFGFTNASAGYKPTVSVLPLEFRYNVVNTHHYLGTTTGIPNVVMPYWTRMEFGAQAPATSVAQAFLYRVNRCTGEQTLICQVRHNNQPAPGICKTCTFANTTFNFASYLYYVRVTLDRNTYSENPMAHTLRIY